MKNSRSFFFVLLIGILSLAVSPIKPAEGLDLLVSGTWTFQQGEAFWSSSAPVLQSTPGSVALHVVNARDNDEPWRIEVRLLGLPLPEGAKLWLRRSGTGQGGGWIRDGLAFIPVGESPALLFSGAGDRMQVPLQMKVTGITPRTPAGTLRTSLLFSVVSLR